MGDSHSVMGDSHSVMRESHSVMRESHSVMGESHSAMRESHSVMGKFYITRGIERRATLCSNLQMRYCETCYTRSLSPFVRNPLSGICLYDSDICPR
ncbi:hypothetical protein PilKf_01769 [Pillotina sp. SPG140]|jgi:hypothetical protein